MANLAIRGHLTRGKEVIEILEMLGGKNVCKYTGNNVNDRLYYLIDEDFDIVSHYFDDSDDDYNYNNKNCIVYTLEEFLKKYPYKVGDNVVYEDDNDIVTIVGIKWDDDIDDIFYNVKRINEDDCFLCPPELLTSYKEKNMEELKEQLLLELVLVKQGKELIPHKDYEIKQIDNKFYLVKKKSQYPKTYEECCKIIMIDEGFDCNPFKVMGYEAQLLTNFQKLLICRDAYWKIAGEQMNLGKPWKPDWNDDEIIKYCIIIDSGIISKQKFRNTQFVFAFPTEEMRDAFYENFKDLIEQCKELL